MFTGFETQAFTFFSDLSQNNNKTWWQAHKQDFETFVKTPIQQLAGELAVDYGEPYFFRPNRDTRFSHDKSPYKLNSSFFIEDKETGYYFEITAEGIFVGGGMYELASDQLTAWRSIFDSKESAKVDGMIKNFQSQGFEFMRDGELKSAPRGWKSDHPYIEYLRLKHAALGKRHTKEEAWMNTRECFNKVVEGLEIVKSWNEILKKHVGPSKLERKWK